MPSLRRAACCWHWWPSSIPSQLSASEALWLSFQHTSPSPIQLHSSSCRLAQSTPPAPDQTPWPGPATPEIGADRDPSTKSSTHSVHISILGGRFPVPKAPLQISPS